LAVFGTWKQIPIAVTVVTIVMVFVLIFMVMFGLILGMSTGVVMEDIEYYYDTQYPKLRSAMEKVDNSYCQMTKEQCKELIVKRNDNSHPGAKVQTSDYKEDVAPDGVQKYVTFARVQKHMYAEAAAAASETDSSGNPTAPTWLNPCKTTAICIYCGDLLGRTQVVQKSVFNNLATSPNVPGTSCDRRTDGATCIEKAPNFMWVSGLSGALNMSTTHPIVGNDHVPLGQWVAATAPLSFGGAAVPAPPPGVSYTGTAGDADGGGSFFKVDVYDAWFKPKWTIIGAKRAQLVDDNTVSRQVGYASGVADGLSEDSLMCMGIDAMDRDFSNPSDVDDTDECYGVFSVNENKDMYNVRCAHYGSGQGTVPTNLGAMKRAQLATPLDPCGTATNTAAREVDVESADDWTSKVANFSKYDTQFGGAKEALPYCEEAIVEYVQDDRYCKDYGQQTDNQKWTYYANCDSCSSAFYDFSFNLPGPEAAKRQCLNFVIGHFRDNCGTVDANSCFEAIHSLTLPTSGTHNRNSDYLIDKAYSDGSSFCGYDDESCKAKIKWDIEGSMTGIGIAGCIFLGFFMATIYATLVAIEHYKGGDDDDDSDE
jgi:hypothetical protein